MRERHAGMDPLEPVLLQWQRVEVRGGRAERMDRRAEVVDETGQRELRAARAAADRRLGLAYPDLQARTSERDRGRKSVRPAADDLGVDARQ